MGSSKKHKEKDREGRSSNKRHHRSRSRSKERHGPTRGEKHRERKVRSRSKERDRPSRKRTRESLIVVPEKTKLVKEDHRETVSRLTSGGGGGSSGGGDISLSIEETNKLRAKLGLKPLETKESSSSKTDGGDKDFVHKPPENLSDKQFVEKLREKIQAQKQKREIDRKLSKVKTLADSDSEEDVTRWVSKSRQLELEKKKAEARAKLLEEMDDEFGVGNLVEDELKQLKASVYSERNLKGLKVEHATSSFGEGKTVILTLKDKGVLDEEEGDVLVNVNIIDEEKALKNTERKKAKPGYVPYEEDIDEFGNMKRKTLLSKYDEEIEGEQMKSFVLGRGGVSHSVSERELVRQKLQQKHGAVSLDLPVSKLASEYYTDDEMVTFKKPGKKVRRKVHRKPLKADELLAISNEIPMVASDLGSRRRGRIKEIVDEDSNDLYNDNENSSSSVNYDTEDMDIEHDADDVEILGPEEDLTNVRIEPDEAEMELQLVLNKARKLRQRDQLKSAADKVADKVKSFYDFGQDEDAGAGKGSIVLNATAEFCRALGDIPTYGMSGNRDEDVEDLMDFDEEAGDERAQAADEEVHRSAWNEVEVIEDEVTEIKKEDVTILDEEPDVSLGIAGALQLAMKKGYLDKEMKKVVSAPRHSTLQATSYTIEDKTFLEDDRLGRRERFSAGPVTDFKDRDSYKPDVKLEYIDDNGRLLNPKEAFRYLSHKFHGKGSGKNKTEKRMKKLQEEALMRQMSSTDTPLGTLALLQEKQRQTQSPYIVLSGGSKAINSSAISKTK